MFLSCHLITEQLLFIHHSILYGRDERKKQFVKMGGS